MLCVARSGAAAAAAAGGEKRVDAAERSMVTDEEEEGGKDGEGDTLNSGASGPCTCTEEGSYLRLIGFCITQL